MIPQIDFGELVWIFVAACVVNNFTLSYFLGLCPFLGVSGRILKACRYFSECLVHFDVSKLPPVPCMSTPALGCSAR